MVLKALCSFTKQIDLQKLMSSFQIVLVALCYNDVDLLVTCSLREQSSPTKPSLQSQPRKDVLVFFLER